jgi:hypothetical protein
VSCALSVGACTRDRAPLAPARLATAPPPDGCSLLGRASGTATEESRALATRHARDKLESQADDLGGSYIELTAERVTRVEMALDAFQVRVEGSIYRCPSAFADASAEAPGEVAAPTPGALLTVSCPPPSEAQKLDAAEGLGSQCVRRLGDGWVAHGPYVLYWTSGATKAEGSFENGKRSGIWSFYYANGQLRERATFRAGEREGCGATFDAEGNALPAPCADGGPPKD